MELFDSHAHLSVEGVYNQIEQILSRAQENKINHIINICIDEKSLIHGLEINSNYSWVLNAGATTPHDVDKLGDVDFPFFEKAAKSGQLVAIGETGLDYFYEHSDKKNQQKFLIRYLHLAQEADLPVIFHCREAFDDLFSIVDKEYKGPAVLHCFTGTKKEAEEVIKRGWYLSLSGIVTFKKSDALREVAKIVPLDQLLIETDTPYLAPNSKRGKPNEPSFIIETAQMIADIKQMSLEEFAKATFENAKRCFFPLAIY